MNKLSDKLKSLIKHLDQHPKLTVAVSGGIDSMLLMYIAKRYSQTQATAAHAYSAAVPSSAFILLKQYAKQYQWALSLLDAKELADKNYQANPVNRCYYCKSNLYQRIAQCFDGAIASGTNLDDLSDYRPGLQAAKEYQVHQPYVEAGINKQDIYQLAAQFNLHELKNLPAQPCLASRVETGIQIESDKLKFIDQVETLIKTHIGHTQTVRCRIKSDGVVIQVSKHLSSQQTLDILEPVRVKCDEQGYLLLGIEAYQKGSAFLNKPIEVRNAAI